jgi:Asp-tRNA(Asn)/Glu-tRNA(Gln) amidotransferase A subunit family amidase
LASLVNVLRGLANGELTSRLYTERLLERIRARDARVQAFSHIDLARARSIADLCDRYHAQGAVLGALHGLPVAVKDIFDATGLRCEMGLAVFANRQPTEDAQIVARLRHAGGFVLGKTVTTEAAYLKPAETRNPWNLAHTPGGSSSGSAAAVAAGFAHGAIGTQTNGSLIRPAAYCGVVGFKPTAGLMSTKGALHFSPTLDQAGVFARSVADVCALVGPLAEGPSLATPVTALAAPPRLGLIVDFQWTSLEPEARQHLAHIARKLTARGATIQPIELAPRFADANQVHRTIMMHEGARQLRELQDRHRLLLSALLNDALDEGRRISTASYGEALVRRARLAEAIAEVFQSFDAVISPPAAGPAPARLDTTGDPGYCTLWSLLGVPALVVPSGFAMNGLPLGLQIATRAGDDKRLLAVAAWIEAAIGPLSRAGVA